MDYGYKQTTAGRELLAACLATGKGLEITRVAVGSGRVSEGTDLAGMTGLVQYVAEGALAENRHEENAWLLTVQYASNMTPGLGAFYLSEFIVEARHPISGETVTLLYGTLGDHIQSVCAYSETQAPEVRNYPVVLAISDEISVTISAVPGLVTYYDLARAVGEACGELNSVKQTVLLTIPASGWVEAEEPSADHKYICDAAAEGVTADLVPSGGAILGSFGIASRAGVVNGCETLEGCIRFFSQRVPEGDIQASVTLFGKGVGSAYALPPASSGTLGAVKIQEDSGLTVDSEGNLSIAKATGQEVSEAIEEVFGGESAPEDGPTQDDVPAGYEVASDQEVTETIQDIFDQGS